MGKFAPIVLFVYNRPWHTAKTIEDLLQNAGASNSDLFIFSDAPKHKADEEKVEAVREYIREIKGFKSLTIIERPFNWGLAKSVIQGVSEVVSKYGRLIVLEDDHSTSPFFLEYMNAALDRYEFEEEVISIHGYMYPVKKELPNYFFLKGADCWGWATWKRGWDLFEPDGKKLLNQLKSKKKSREFDFNNSYPYTKMLAGQVQGKNNSWAILWYASAFLNDKLTLYPGTSLIQNIGLDSTGTHCEISTQFDTIIQTKRIDLEYIAIQENFEAKKVIEDYFNTIKARPLPRLKSAISNIFK